jgi:hypothetical protein
MWVRRLLIVCNGLVGIAATIVLFNGPLPDALRPYNSSAWSSWLYVAAFMLVIATCAGNMAYIHQTAAKPFDRWQRFVAAWKASKPPH